MAEKNLPIKFFQKRQRDEQDTEAGGGGQLPKWIDASSVGEKSIYIRQVLGNVSHSLAEKVKRNNYIPSVVRLKLNSDALAKTYRRDIGNLFNVGKLNTIGVSGEDEVLIKIDNQEDLQQMTEKIANADNEYPSQSTVTGICAITNIEEFKPQISIEPNESTILQVKLFNYGDSSLNSVLIKEFEKYCKKFQLEFKSAPYSGELNIYRINGYYH